MDNFSNQNYWLIGELAEAAGVSADTLRHYERKGVLKCPPRKANGYRSYPENTLDRVRLVRRALAVGFTLEELARILSERDKGGVPCREARRLVAEKLSDLEEQLIALTDLRDERRLTLNDWDERLSAAASETQVNLLETLISSSANKNQPPLQKLEREKSISKFNKKRKTKNERI